MQRTFALLGTYMQKHKTNSYEPGRTALYSVTDVMRKDMHILMMMQPLAANDSDEWEDLDDNEPKVEDEADFDTD